jgi:O-antigen ligase
VALYLSFARGAWLALVTGGAAYFLLKRKLLFAAFVTTILLSAGIVFWLVDNNRYLRFAHDYNTTIYHTNFREHLIATYQLKDVSTAERYYRWIAGVRMSEDSWQTGFGPNTFYEHYKSYTVPAFKTWVSKNEERSTVHNYFLLLLIEQGVIGMLLFIVLLGTLFWYVQRNFHDTGSESEKRIWAVLAVIITMICVVNFLSDLIETDKVGSIFYLCIALLVLLDRKLLNPPFQENL